jgi:hypothetical protein
MGENINRKRNTGTGTVFAVMKKIEAILIVPIITPSYLHSAANMNRGRGRGKKISRISSFSPSHFFFVSFQIFSQVPAAFGSYTV